MKKAIESQQPLTKSYRSVPITAAMKQALAKHMKTHLTVEDAAEALGIKRRETLGYVLKTGSCSSETYNKILVLVNPELAQNTEAPKSE